MSRRGWSAHFVAALLPLAAATAVLLALIAWPEATGLALGTAAVAASAVYIFRHVVRPGAAWVAPNARAAAGRARIELRLLRTRRWDRASRFVDRKFRILVLGGMLLLAAAVWLGLQRRDRYQVLPRNSSAGQGVWVLDRETGVVTGTPDGVRFFELDSRHGILRPIPRADATRAGH